MREATAPASPYKGLVPYTEDDAAFFFGRESERELIAANLIASRLTLLYGSSGVGKSSVLHAGVVHQLGVEGDEQRAANGAAEFAVVALSGWRDDPLIRLKERVREAVRHALPGNESFEDPADASFVDVLRSHGARLRGGLLIILDQFEEYFLYHPEDDGQNAGTFDTELPRAVNQSDLRAHFLISIREDALAKLDRFKGRIPSLFSNYLRIENLDREAARAAITKPIRKYNEWTQTSEGAVGIEPELVDAVLDQVKTGQVTFGLQTGLGVVKSGGTREERIETPYLQVVMTRLWTEEMAQKSRTLRVSTLTQLGGARQIVRTHLDATMSTLKKDEQASAARMFNYLVTPSGTKIAHTIGDLADFAGIAKADADPVLSSLSTARILRSVPPPPDRPAEKRYEIFHDVLAAAILDWRRRFLEAPLRPWMAVRAGLYAAAPACAALAIALGAMMTAGPRVGWDLASMRVLLVNLAVFSQIIATALVGLRVRRLQWMYGIVIALVAGVVSIGCIALLPALLIPAEQEKGFRVGLFLWATLPLSIGTVLCWTTGLGIGLVLDWRDERRHRRVRGVESFGAKVVWTGKIGVLLAVVFWTACVTAVALEAPFQQVFFKPMKNITIVVAFLVGWSIVVAVWMMIDRWRGWRRFLVGAGACLVWCGVLIGLLVAIAWLIAPPR